MKRVLTFLALVLGAVIALSACGKNEPKEQEQSSILDYLYPQGRIVRDITVTSSALSRKMNVSLWLPKNYDETKSYPVLYLLHGYGDDQNSWLDKGALAAIATRYVQNGGEEMIIVTPDGLTMFYSGGWETYFYDELIPAIEARYKCNGKMAVAGLSMGGYGTIYHALKYPSKFTYAYAMSPAVMGEMSAYVDAQADKSVFPSFTFEVGNQDTTVSNASTSELADYMKAKGIDVEYIARDGIHYWDFWQECLPKALQKVGESFK